MKDVHIKYPNLEEDIDHIIIGVWDSVLELFHSNEHFTKVMKNYSKGTTYSKSLGFLHFEIIDSGIDVVWALESNKQHPSRRSIYFKKY